MENNLIKITSKNINKDLIGYFLEFLDYKTKLQVIKHNKRLQSALKIKKSHFKIFSYCTELHKFNNFKDLNKIISFYPMISYLSPDKEEVMEGLLYYMKYFAFLTRNNKICLNEVFTYKNFINYVNKNSESKISFKFKFMYANKLLEMLDYATNIREIELEGVDMLSPDLKLIFTSFLNIDYFNISINNDVIQEVDEVILHETFEAMFNGRKYKSVSLKMKINNRVYLMKVLNMFEIDTEEFHIYFNYDNEDKLEDVLRILSNSKNIKKLKIGNSKNFNQGQESEFLNFNNYLITSSINIEPFLKIIEERNGHKRGGSVTCVVGSQYFFVYFLKVNSSIFKKYNSFDIIFSTNCPTYFYGYREIISGTKELNSKEEYKNFRKVNLQITYYSHHEIFCYFVKLGIEKLSLKCRTSFKDVEMMKKLDFKTNLKKICFRTVTKLQLIFKYLDRYSHYFENLEVVTFESLTDIYNSSNKTEFIVSIDDLEFIKYFTKLRKIKFCNTLLKEVEKTRFKMYVENIYPNIEIKILS